MPFLGAQWQLVGGKRSILSADIGATKVYDNKLSTHQFAPNFYCSWVPEDDFLLLNLSSYILYTN